MAFTITGWEGNEWKRTAWRDCTRQEAINHAEGMSERHGDWEITVLDDSDEVVHHIHPFPRRTG